MGGDAKAYEKDLDAKVEQQRRASDEADDKFLAKLAAEDNDNAATAPTASKPSSPTSANDKPQGTPAAKPKSAREDENAGLDPQSIPEMFRALPPREQFAKARAALYRTGLFDREAIDALPERDLLTRGLKAAKTQADVDQTFKERDELRRKASSQTKTVPAPSPMPAQDDEIDDTVDLDETGEEPEPEPRDDNPRGRSADGRDQSDITRAATRAVDARVDQIAEQLGLVPAETRQVRAAMRQAVTEIVAKLPGNTAKADSPRTSSQLAAAHEITVKAIKALAVDRCEQARDSLIEQFPDLADEAEFNAVRQALAARDADLSLLQGPRADFVKAFEEAAWARFGKSMERNVRQSLVKENARARNGQPITDSVRQSPRPLNESEYDDAVLRIIEEHDGDPAGQQKAIAQLNRRST